MRYLSVAVFTLFLYGINAQAMNFSAFQSDGKVGPYTYDILSYRSLSPQECPSLTRIASLPVCPDINPYTNTPDHWAMSWCRPAEESLASSYIFDQAYSLTENLQLQDAALHSWFINLYTCGYDATMTGERTTFMCIELQGQHHCRMV